MNESLDPHPDTLTELDRLNDACLVAPGEIEPQVKLWTAVAALDRWVFINRGTAQAPKPYALAAEPGNMIAIYSSGTRANEAARGAGLVAEGEAAQLFAVPLPQALDWVMSFGQYGVVGVTIDHPRIGAWSPLPNLARLKQNRARA